MIDANMEMRYVCCTRVTCKCYQLACADSLNYVGHNARLFQVFIEANRTIRVLDEKVIMAKSLTIVGGVFSNRALNPAPRGDHFVPNRH